MTVTMYLVLKSFHEDKIMFFENKRIYISNSYVQYRDVFTSNGEYICKVDLNKLREHEIIQEL